MKPHRLETSHWVPYPIELVFAFFATPTNLPHLMPIWQQTRLESSRIQPPPPRPIAADPTLRFQSAASGVGSEMLFSFRPLPGIPLRTQWLALITEFEWFHHFQDVQARGPFAHWKHRHSFAVETREGQPGTRIEDAVEYALPMGPLGAIAHQLFVRQQMRETFAWRQHRLTQILPAVARQATQRAADTEQRNANPR